MKTMLLAAVGLLAIGPAFATHYGYHLGGARLVRGNVAGGAQVVRPAGIGPRQLELAPVPVVRRVNPYTGRKVVVKPSH